MKKGTLYDVAEKSGVSPKTVSRVINNESTVSTRTRELVESAIRASGYRPNTSARSLRTSKSYLLGLLYDILGPEYVLNLQVGIQSVCDKSGYNILIRPCSFESPTLVEDIATLFGQSRIDGLILSPPLSDHTGLLNYLDEENKHYVRIAPFDTQSTSPIVTANDREASAEVTDYLVSLGHRSIGIITGHPDHSASMERLHGYKDCLENAGITLRQEFIQQGYFTFESGEHAAQQLLQQEHAPTAIFACNDYMAAGAMKAAQKLGLHVPEDLSIAGFDDTRLSRQLWPTLTTMRQPVQLIASRSAELLINNILKQDKPITQLGFECELVVRESTAPPKTM